MNRAFPLLAAALLASLTLAVASPGASAFTCDLSNPFPPSPVGGEVGRAYGFATGTAYSVSYFGVMTGCAVLGQVITTVNAQCVFLIGTTCIDIA